MHPMLVDVMEHVNPLLFAGHRRKGQVSTSSDSEGSSEDERKCTYYMRFVQLCMQRHCSF